jgi:hypothetical protein
MLFRAAGAMVFLIAVSMVVMASDMEDEQPGKDKGKGKGKTNIVQVDLSKLHPGIAQYVRENALVGQDGDKGKKKKGESEPEKKKGKGEAKSTSEPEAKKKGKGKGEAKSTSEPEAKKKGKGKGEATTITLADAVRIGERNGAVVKAERKGDGADAVYKLDIRNSNGEKTRLNLDAFGRSTADSFTKKDEKGKGKKK